MDSRIAGSVAVNSGRFIKGGFLEGKEPRDSFEEAAGFGKDGVAPELAAGIMQKGRSGPCREGHPPADRTERQGCP